MINRAPDTPEMQKLREQIAIPSGFVLIEKHIIRDYLDIWSAILEFQGALEQSQVLRGKEKLTRTWALVAHLLSRMG